VTLELARIYGKRPETLPFTAEEIAWALGVRPHVIRGALVTLNLQGVVTQRVNRAPNDSPRDPGSLGWGRDSAWQASVYFLQRSIPTP
jgi:hypothetical protein